MSCSGPDTWAPSLWLYFLAVFDALRCVATKFLDEAGLDRRNGFQQVSNMHALNRTRRALEKTFIFTRESDDRSMAAFFHARGNESDHALMPGAIVNANAVRPALLSQRVDILEGLFPHRRLDISSLAVDLVQDPSIFARRFSVIG